MKNTVSNKEVRMRWAAYTAGRHVEKAVAILSREINTHTIEMAIGYYANAISELADCGWEAKQAECSNALAELRDKLAAMRAAEPPMAYDTAALFGVDE